MPLFVVKALEFDPLGFQNRRLCPAPLEYESHTQGFISQQVGARALSHSRPQVLMAPGALDVVVKLGKGFLTILSYSRRHHTHSA